MEAILNHQHLYLQPVAVQPAIKLYNTVNIQFVEFIAWKVEISSYDDDDNIIDWNLLKNQCITNYRAKVSFTRTYGNVDWIISSNSIW